MNRTSHDTRIVDKYSIALIGWPFPLPIRNPGELDAGQILILERASKDGTCRSKVLNEQEFEAHKIARATAQASGAVTKPSAQKHRRVEEEEEWVRVQLPFVCCTSSLNTIPSLLFLYYVILN